MQDIATKRATDTRVAYQNPWITIHEDKTVTDDGQEGTYAYLESKNSVMVVAQDDEDKIFMVRGFRYPSKSFGWELPGGGGEGEDLLIASQRELEEETGILADTWEEIGSAYVCNGLMTEKMAVCSAKNLHFNGHKETSDEVFEAMRFFSTDEIDALIISGEINDCQTLAALQLHHVLKKHKETV